MARGRKSAVAVAAVEERSGLHPDWRESVRHLPDAPEMIVADTPHQLRDRIEALRRARIKKARVDFNAFVEYVFTSGAHVTPFKQTWFHEEWAKAMSEHDRCLIIAPRDHGKTTQVVARVIWELGRDPNLRIKIACASDGRAKERLYEVVQHIEQNRRVAEVFPRLAQAESGEWSKHKVIVQRTAIHRDASVEAIGITSTATGGRADLLIADDVVDRRNALSFPKLRTQIKQAWRSDWTNLLEPGARVWYICTLWHKDDLSHDLMTNPEFRTKFYAVDDQFGALWPDKWSTADLRKRHREIGTIEFNRAFRNQAVDTESAVVNPGWLKFVDLRKDKEFRERFEHLVFVASYDTAGTPVAGKDPDYAAGVIFAVDAERRHVYVVDAWHARISVAAQAERIFAEAQRYKPFRILIEKVGQATVDEWLLREHPELLGVVQVTKPRVSKHQRLLGVTPLMEAGHVTFHEALNPNASGWSPERGALVHELEDFPFAKNDDLVDAFSQGLAGARDQILDADLHEPEIVFNIGDEEDDGYLW